LITRETVFKLTPARCATSRIVGLVALTATFLLTPPDGVTALSDNVVGGTVRAEGVSVKGVRTLVALPGVPATAAG
jgi:hypothetical protein